MHLTLNASIIRNNVIDSMLTAKIKTANKKTNLLHLNYTFQDSYKEAVNMKNNAMQNTKSHFILWKWALSTCHIANAKANTLSVFLALSLNLTLQLFLLCTIQAVSMQLLEAIKVPFI